jgi:DNA-directed RNA polymerase specialized sigma24 family protein
MRLRQRRQPRHRLTQSYDMPTPSGTPLIETLASPEPDVHRLAESSHLLAELEQRAALSMNAQAVYWMDYEGLSGREAADLLGVKTNTLKGRRHRGVQELRAILR